MEDNKIKEGILRKSEQIVHADSETDAALIFCVNEHVDIWGRANHTNIV